MKLRFKERHSSSRFLCIERIAVDRCVYHVGFTLTELLVVIVIIAVLCAIIAPAIGRGIVRAKGTKSLANLRAIGAGINLYIGEHQGMFPLAATKDPPVKYWCQLMEPYLPKVVTFVAWNGPAQVSPVLIDPLVSSDRHHALGDYGVNQDVFRVPDWPSNASLPIPPDGKGYTVYSMDGRLSKVVSVMTAEGGDKVSPTGSWFIDVKVIVEMPLEKWGTTGRPGDRGTGRYLCLFADAHTEAIEKNDFYNRRRELLRVISNP